MRPPSCDEGAFHTLTMKNMTDNTKLHIAFAIVATTAAVVAIGLNLAWFGLYELVKDHLNLSYPRAAIVFGGITWFLAMLRFVAKGGTDLSKYS